MKRILGLTLLLAAVSSQGQLFTPESVRGAAFGALVGGIVGHNTDGRSAEWAGVGAGAGLLLGSIAHQAHQREGRSQTIQNPYPSPSHYGTFPPQARPSYRPNYATTGVLVGGLTGGIIGHNTDGHSAEWAAVGAGAGLILGGIAEAEAQKREAGVIAHPPPQAAPEPARTSPATHPPTDAANRSVIIKSYSQPKPSPMADANRLFGR